MGKVEFTLSAVNERLKESRVKVRLKQRGESLSLVATLPPKPGDERPYAYQQTVALGIPASETGFRRAEEEARRMGSMLALGQFDWRFYLDEANPKQYASYQIQRFKAHYMSTHSLTERTWEKHWAVVFKDVPQQSVLEPDVLLSLVNATERNTRHRLQTCQKLQQLADFAGLTVNLLQYKGNYSSSRVQDRDLPEDLDIIRYRDQIPNPGWRCVYSLMAALGLRDHECFFCEWTPEGLKVLEGKTGPRLVFVTLYPQWEEEWDLRNIILPPVDRTKGYDYLSDRMGKAFKRYKIPWTPYTLRHCFASRASNTFGYPIPVSAALMGHSPEVHMRIYQKHLTLHQMKKTSKDILAGKDRHPPSAKPPEGGHEASEGDI